ncbi:UPAR/Ly6 domain-containing protein crok [Anabrus simplex]|uniref:UPAR/Ly6 domain-containing protein crok n=1 Tax=Anabrus simplex TaxID=316456 RepID=UPI0034DD45E7
MVLERVCGVLVLLGLILLSIVHSGEAIKCFECNSHNDTACANDLPPENFKKDCSEHSAGSNYVLCRKIVQHIDFEVNGNKPEKRVIRSCGWDDSSYKGRCYQRSGFGGRQEVCACEQDYCNGAPSIPQALTTLSATTVLYALHRVLF